MADQKPEHRFINYQPPPVTEILDPDFRQAFIDQKLANIANGIKATLLRDNTAEEFVRGETPLCAQYECAGLAFLYGIELDENTPQHDLEIVSRPIFEHVIKGIGSALQEKRLNGRLMTGFDYDFDKYEPSILRVVVSARPPEE